MKLVESAAVEVEFRVPLPRFGNQHRQRMRCRVEFARGEQLRLTEERTLEVLEASGLCLVEVGVGCQVLGKQLPAVAAEPFRRRLALVAGVAAEVDADVVRLLE